MNPSIAYFSFNPLNLPLLFAQMVASNTGYYDATAAAREHAGLFIKKNWDKLNNGSNWKNCRWKKIGAILGQVVAALKNEQAYKLQCQEHAQIIHGTRHAIFYRSHGYRNPPTRIHEEDGGRNEFRSGLAYTPAKRVQISRVYHPSIW
ncbi:hypothetical protein BC938DRAFT_481488 [Jimgerdemannia flammicorona]|uniref:Uncharacterized protein n=1 Tax=Jimgerdemannia flammicorona TaxID=994334 RepID=A0A433QX44_9FUNG|nr:hypothetical protein BC938DRAFT_481488 [Jimgerdemannia flammicorona]